MSGGFVSEAAWTKDVQFIVEEIDRFSKIDLEEMARSYPHDALQWISAGRGRGHVIIGQKAADRLRKLCEIYISRQPRLSGRIESRLFRSALEKEIIKIFIDKGFHINEQRTSSILNKSMKACLRSMVDRTHFIPCHIVRGDEPRQFHIGPVRFSCLSQFREEKNDLFEKTISAMTQERRANYPLLARYKDASPQEIESAASDFATSSVRQAIDHLGRFGWIAEVKVKGCDKEISRLRAYQAVNAAVDTLRLLRKPGYSNKMHVDLPGGYANHALITHVAGQLLDLTLALGGGPAETASPDWWEQLANDGAAATRLRQAGDAIQSVTCPAQAPLAQRFLDALRWFGAGCEDELPAGRVVKFVTAIERAVMERNGSDVTGRFVDRVAAAASSGERGSFDLWRGRAAEIYEFRSGLVHGSTSPYDVRVVNMSVASCLTCQLVLVGILGFFTHLGMLTTKVSQRRLTAIFNTYVENAKSISAGGLAYRIPPFA